MEFRNSFQVPVPVEQAWDLFTDVQRIAPCMPGAAITGDLGDGRYEGHASVKLGPVTLRFAGQAEFVEHDEATHTVRFSASGREQTGRGDARALVTSHLVGGDGVTEVEVVTDLQLSGAVARFGRQGIVSDVSATLVGDFATCLSRQLAGDVAAAGPATASGASERAARPHADAVSVLALLRQLVTRVARRWWERLHRLRNR